MILKTAHLLLADDDLDDCFLFSEALLSLSIPTQLTTVHDGEQLMKFFSNDDVNIPDILFLDINMPRKNGFECLDLIRQNERLNQLCVIVYSTSLDPGMVNQFYEKGAQHYIQKPSEFSKLMSIINNAVVCGIENDPAAIGRDKFVITG